MTDKDHRPGMAAALATFVAGAIMMAISVPGALANGNDSPGECAGGTTYGLEEGHVGVLIAEPEPVTGICIKAGDGAFGDSQHSGVITEDGIYGGGCYAVAGLDSGGAFVFVQEAGEEGCKDISHVDAVTTPTPTPTGTSTSTPTPTASPGPTPTFTATPTSTATPTPTATPRPTPSPTPTSSPTTTPSTTLIPSVSTTPSPASPAAFPNTGGDGGEGGLSGLERGALAVTGLLLAFVGAGTVAGALRRKS